MRNQFNVNALEHAKANARALVTNPAMGALAEAYAEIASKAIWDYLEFSEHHEEDKPSFYECGICGAYHPADWNGDCRQDHARFDPSELDKQYGPEGWREIAMPEGQWSQWGK